MYRLRLKLAKRGRLQFISHLETMQALARAARRAGLPVALTKGFNPRPKMSWGPPLRVGLKSEAEYLDLFLDQFVPPLEALKALKRALPEDLFPSEAKYVVPEAKSLGRIIDTAMYEVEVKVGSGFGPGHLSEMLADLKAQKEVVVERKNGTKPIDLTTALVDIGAKLNGHMVQIDMTIAFERANLRPEEVIDALFAVAPKPPQYEIQKITRTGLYARKGGTFIDPISFAGARI